MAQIHVFGYVEEDLIPKQGQTSNAYVCFHLREHMGKGRWQTYQVWAWGSDVHRMKRLGIKSGSWIWLTGKGCCHRTAHRIPCKGLLAPSAESAAR